MDVGFEVVTREAFVADSAPSIGPLAERMTKYSLCETSRIMAQSKIEARE
jgi:hypothetical protein